MEGGAEGLRTVDCLRGRLLAERAASRAAKDDADHLDSKVKELEKHLETETTAKKRIEKKLTFLKNKLQSLNIPFVYSSDDYSDNSISISASSSTSSSSSSSRASVFGYCISSTGSYDPKVYLADDPLDNQQNPLNLISNSSAVTTSTVSDQSKNSARTPILLQCCRDRHDNVLASDKKSSSNGHGCRRCFSAGTLTPDSVQRQNPRVISNVGRFREGLNNPTSTSY